MSASRLLGRRSGSSCFFIENLKPQLEKALCNIKLSGHTLSSFKYWLLTFTDMGPYGACLIIGGVSLRNLLRSLHICNHLVRCNFMLNERWGLLICREAESEILEARHYFIQLTHSISCTKVLNHVCVLAYG
ncbi:unnamed protein product [Moneuplotes crassus]|uniref:Uncharacterized protein n=1 Tax=Euplotes crassus TaxID=5936 RepID=A0AAD2D1N7_EUPCR|nr:unnamed protein product [Moneuplotes crassus]